MTQLNLLPLTVNTFTPTFTGQVLLLKDNKTCINDNCIQLYCTIEHNKISQRCHIHLLEDTSTEDCQITAMNENTCIISSQSESSL